MGLAHKCFNSLKRLAMYQGILKGEVSLYLLFDWFGISCMTTDNFCFYLQNRLIQTSQTGGQQYSGTSPFSIPCMYERSSLIALASSDEEKSYLYQSS